MTKKIVHYEYIVTAHVGECALLKPFDHPNTSNERVVKTSPVISIQDGVIETHFTIYKPL